MLRRMSNRPSRREDLLAAGLTDGRLRSKAFRSPFHGVHADASVPESVERRIRDVVAILPWDGVIGGWAAAWVHGSGTSTVDAVMRNSPCWSACRVVALCGRVREWWSSGRS